jgi:predicted TIM-barrel fold metal-dependent hydrolase
MASSDADRPWKIIDFHTHIRPPWWKPPAAAPGAFALPPEVVGKFTQPRLLVEESEAGDIDLRLLSSPVEGIFGADGPVDAAVIARLNDYLAELVAAHPRRLAALATVDAFAGEAAAREAERAVRELGHVGIVIDSSRSGLFPGEASVRPTLAAAAELRVPIFVHPVAAPHSEPLIRAARRAGNSFGRGLVNGVAFLSILRSGILDALPDLHLVFTAIGAGALVMAAADGKDYAAEARTKGGPRPNIYFDIMGLDPAVLRFLVEFLGAERVLVGTDWPIHPGLTRATLASRFRAARLSRRACQLVAEGNARRLLGLRVGAEAASEEKLRPRA